MQSFPHEHIFLLEVSGSSLLRPLFALYYTTVLYYTHIKPFNCGISVYNFSIRYTATNQWLTCRSHMERGTTVSERRSFGKLIVVLKCLHQIWEAAGSSQAHAEIPGARSAWWSWMTSKRRETGGSLSTKGERGKSIYLSIYLYWYYKYVYILLTSLITYLLTYFLNYLLTYFLTYLLTMHIYI